MMKKLIWVLAFIVVCGFATALDSYCTNFNETSLYACWDFDQNFTVTGGSKWVESRYPIANVSEEWLDVRGTESQMTFETTQCILNNCIDVGNQNPLQTMLQNNAPNGLNNRMLFPNRTITWWSKADDTNYSTTTYIIDFSAPSSGTQGQARVETEASINNTIRFVCGSNISSYDLSNSNTSLDSWVYYSIVQNLTECEFYVDGSLITTLDNNLFANTGDASGGIAIGARGLGETDLAHPARYDDFLVYNRTLTSGEITTLYNYATSNTTVECNDGLDNDNDTLIDLADPSCDDINDNNESPQDFFECNDGIDNDADSFTDYPNDPSCTSATDNSEAPFDSPQCDDGVDNDLDGFTDFPSDPSCDNITDNSELPKDGTLQPEDECLVAEQCILFDSIPYNDAPELHNWTGSPLDIGTINYLGGDHILINTLDDDGFKFNQFIRKDATNVNNYNEVHAQLQMFLVANTSSSVDDEQVAVQFLDSNNDVTTTLILNITTTGASPYIAKVNLYSNDGGTLTYIGAVFVDAIGYIQLDWDFDELSNQYDLTVAGINGSVSLSNFNYDDALLSVNRFFLSNTIATDDMQVIMSEINIFGTDYQVVDTVCDTWTSPFYLKESFLGFQSECDWIVSNDIFFFGELSIPQALSFYFQQKDLSEVARDENVRYVTMTYDLNVVNVTVGSTITFRLYDEEDFNFWTVFYRDSGDDLWYNDDGTGVVAQSSIPNNQSFAYKFVIDLQQDEFDIYFNDSLIVSDAGLTEAFYNLETIKTIKISSNDAEYTMDNLYIFASDSGGTELLPDDDAPIEEVDQELSMCGYFHNNQINCIDDDDCETGDCLPSNKCSRFDFTYCDENSIKRGSWCMANAITGCATSTAGSLILDYFFQFLVLLVFIMGMVYLGIIFMRGRRSG